MLAKVVPWTCNLLARHLSAPMNVRSAPIAHRATKASAPTVAENWFGVLGAEFLLRAKKRLNRKSRSQVGQACFGERASGYGPSFRWLLPPQFTSCIARSMAGCG